VGHKDLKINQSNTGFFVFTITQLPGWAGTKALKVINLLHNTHTIVLLLIWNLSGTTQVSRYQKGKTGKGKTNLNLLEQEIVSGSGICWTMCTMDYVSAPHPRQPRQHPTTQLFTGRMPFLPPNQQHQSTEGITCYMNNLLHKKAW